jgi:hypothetical protein
LVVFVTPESVNLNWALAYALFSTAIWFRTISPVEENLPSAQHKVSGFRV